MFRYKLGMNEEKSSLVSGYYVEFRYMNSVEIRGGIVPGGGRILLRTENRVRSAADRDFDFTTAKGSLQKVAVCS